MYPAICLSIPSLCIYIVAFFYLSIYLSIYHDNGAYNKRNPKKISTYLVYLTEEISEVMYKSYIEMLFLNSPPDKN